MMVFDCHVHPWASIDQILASKRQANVDKICLFSVAVQVNETDFGKCENPDFKDVEAGNNHVIEAIQDYPDEITGFCFLNPRDLVHCREEAERCVRDGVMQGIKLWISARCSEPSVFEVAKIAEDLRVPLLVHCWNKATGNYRFESTSRDVAILAEAFPSLSIIAAHVSGMQEIGVMDLAAYPNVYVDTSGADSESGILEFAVRELGAERLLFGSDYPGRTYGGALGRILAAKISREDKIKILGQNFIELLEKRYARSTHAC